MSDVLVLLPLTLATVLIASGILKLRDFEGTRRSLDDLPLPSFVRHRWFARTFPTLELLLGTTLLVAIRPFYAIAASLAVFLFLSYLALVVAVTTSPKPVVCNCFGALSTSPVGWKTVVRNSFFLAISIGTLVDSLYSDGAAFRMPLEAASTWFLIVALPLFALASWRAGRSLDAGTAPLAISEHEKLESLSELEVVDWNSNPLTLKALAQGSEVIIIFVKLDCTACELVTSEIPDWVSKTEPQTKLILATSSHRTDFLAKYPSFRERTVWGYRSLIRGLRVGGVPAAVLITERGFQGPVHGADEIRRLINSAASSTT